MSSAGPCVESPGTVLGPAADRAPARGPCADLAASLAAELSEAAVVRSGEPLAARTTLRVGGPADVYVEPAHEQDLAAVLRFCERRSLPWFLLGRGSNLLVRDGGYRGVIICLAQPVFREIGVEGLVLRAGAGASLRAVAAAARRHELAGFEFLEGIPGSVGGALRMNAGAMGSSIFDIIERVRFMDCSGRVDECAAADLPVSYRRCPFFDRHLALAAVLRGTPGDASSIRSRTEVCNRRRWETQPPQPSAGCIFKNPSAIPAGKLVEELGFKGRCLGGALVSPRHGNFIVNAGGASAQDILTLIEQIRERARLERGIVLETEVEIVGDGLPMAAGMQS